LQDILSLAEKRHDVALAVVFAIAGLLLAHLAIGARDGVARVGVTAEFMQGHRKNSQRRRAQEETLRVHQIRSFRQ
jgi:hypothetical protein